MPKSSARKLRISEADVQTAVVQILELDGWRAIRTHPQPPIVQRLDAIFAKASPLFRSWWKLLRGYVLTHTHAESFGEANMPDYLFIRYQCVVVLKDTNEVLDADPPCCQVLWVEFKAPGKSSKTHQLDWHLEERLRGALVMVVDSVDDFREWYKTSGLMRHQILS